jgi:hypothetical protein
VNRILGLVLVVVGLAAPLAATASSDRTSTLPQVDVAQFVRGTPVAYLPDNPLSGLSIDDVTVTEGDSGAAAVFTVSLDAASSDQVTVDYATSDGTAQAPDDYSAASGTLTIPPGENSGTLTVQVSGDVLDEADETFSVNLSNAVNATIVDGAGAGTILDDDPRRRSRSTMLQSSRETAGRPRRPLPSP